MSLQTAHIVVATVDWEKWLALSTIVLTVATVVLAAAAVYAAVVALSGLSESRAVAEFTKNLAEADTRRRRAEASHEALRRYMAVHDTQHPVMLKAARAVTAEREQIAKSPGSPTPRRCTIQELLTGDDAPESAIDALQACLDSLEEIAVGVRLGIYDEYVIYHGAGSKIRQNLDQGQAHITRSREGLVPHRRAQATAYVHTEWLVRTRFEEITKEGAPTTLAGALDEN